MSKNTSNNLNKNNLNKEQPQPLDLCLFILHSLMLAIFLILAILYIKILVGCVRYITVTHTDGYLQSEEKWIQHI